MISIRILCVEDSKDDLALLSRTLKKAGLDFQLTSVNDLKELRQNLTPAPDILLSDFHLPGFTALEILAVVKEMDLEDLPVIVVSGAVREEEAVDLMRMGARDFVRKDNPARLVPAILRELREAEQRRRRQEAEAELAHNQEITAKILQSTQDGLYILDREGRILSMTGAGASRLTTTENAMVGRDFLDLWLRPQDQAAFKAAQSRALNGSFGKFVALHQNGEALTWWNVAITPIFESRAVPQQILAVAREVTEERRNSERLRRQTTDLQEALGQAESANQMKTAFLANMSHEIRTPIGAMMGFSELLLDSSTSNEEKSEFVEIIRRNGESLLRLLNEILDLSKIEAGHLKIEKIDVDLTTLLSDVIADIRLRAEQKGLKFNTQIDPAIAPVIRTDPIRLKQILSNLLGNAVKFTAAGHIDFRIAQEETPDGSFLCFWVRDTGIGISSQDQSKLFKAFSQGDSSLTRRYGGTGLGLALSQRLAQALDGEIRIQSSFPSLGSEFVARIQLEAAANAPARSEQAPLCGVNARSSLQGVRLLVAEDSRDNQALLQRVLINHGAHVDVAADGEEAIRKALSSDHHAVLMDLQMPRIDGLSATRQLRAQSYDRPIIAITAHAMPEDRETSLRSGFDAYLSKPFDFNELVRLLASLVHRSPKANQNE